MSQKPSRSEHVTAGSVASSSATFSHLLIKPWNWRNFFVNRSCVCPTAALIKSLASGGRSGTEHWIWSHSWHMASSLFVSLSKTDLKIGISCSQRHFPTIQIRNYLPQQNSNRINIRTFLTRNCLLNHMMQVNSGF